MAATGEVILPMGDFTCPGVAAPLAGVPGLPLAGPLTAVLDFLAFDGPGVGVVEPPAWALGVDGPGDVTLAFIFWTTCSGSVLFLFTPFWKETKSDWYKDDSCFR